MPFTTFAPGASAATCAASDGHYPARSLVASMSTFPSSEPAASRAESTAPGGNSEQDDLAVSRHLGDRVASSGSHVVPRLAPQLGQRATHIASPDRSDLHH
jgi:hypothetical protein